ncbi:UNVERIFIED_CONTAM: hypothetical protein FKN15_006283 [Acipenser sinensis]
MACKAFEDANINIPMGAFRPGAGHPVKRRDDSVNLEERLRLRLWMHNSSRGPLPHSTAFIDGHDHIIRPCDLQKTYQGAAVDLQR